MTTPEIEALFDQFESFPTSDQYEETLSCVDAAMSEPETFCSPSESPSSEASSLPVSSETTSSTDGAFNELQALIAASALISKLESICSSGVLPIEDEMSTRELIIRATKVFRFETQAERGAA